VAVAPYKSLRLNYDLFKTMLRIVNYDVVYTGFI